MSASIAVAPAALRVPAARVITLSATLAVAYFVAGKLALLLAIPPGYATPVWPAAGMALAGILLAGYRCWPGVWLGSFAVNLSVGFNFDSPDALGQALLVASGIATGAAMQAAASAWLVRRTVGFPTALAQPREVVQFFVMGGVGCLVNPLVGSSTLLAVGAILPSEMVFTATTWWVGDAIGVLTFAPLVLVAMGEPRALWRQRTFTVALPLGLVFGVMVVWFAYSSALEVRSQQARFAERAAVVEDVLTQQRDRHLEILQALAALFETSNEVTGATFQAFTRRALERYPSINGLAWLPRVTNDARAAFVRAVREGGFGGFEITERRDGKVLPAAPRAEYHPVLYAEPIASTIQTLGFDVASEPVRRAALTEARASGKPAASARIELIGDGRHPGILLVAPVMDSRFDQRMRGFVAMTFRADVALAPVIETALQEGMQIRLSDVDAAADNRLLFSNAASAGRDALHCETTLDMAGRTWRMEFAPTPAYLVAQRSWGPWTALALGLLFAGLLGVSLLVQTGRTAAIEATVAERTAELSDAYRALARGERFLRTVTDTMPAMIGYLDAELRFRFHNRAYEEWLGLSTEQIKDKHPREVFGAAVYAGIEPWAKRALAGEDCTYERIQHGASGTPLHFECHYVPDRAPDGRVLGFYCLLIDITARKEIEGALHRSREMLRAVTDNVPAFIAYLDADERHRFVNSASADWHGLPEQVLGKSVREVIGEEAYTVVRPFIARAFAGERVSFDREGPNGTTRHVQYVPNRDPAGRVRGLYVTVTDLTERRQQQRELERSNRELRDFAHVVSHDLKEPLRGITGTLGMISRRLDGGPDADTARLMELAIDAAKRQMRQIDDLLAYTRIGSDTKPPEPVDCNALVADLLADYRALFVESGADVAVAALPTVSGHRSQLRQLLQNLLGNALKFRSRERLPQIRLAAERRGERWEFRVVDNGIGIPARHADRIFGLFQRLHTVEEYPGSGIGLAICKKVVERHNGTIRVESVPGEGSTFIFTLPISDPGDPAPAGAPQGVT